MNSNNIEKIKDDFDQQQMSIACIRLSNEEKIYEKELFWLNENNLILNFLKAYSQTKDRNLFGFLVNQKNNLKQHNAYAVDTSVQYHKLWEYILTKLINDKKLKANENILLDFLKDSYQNQTSFIPIENFKYFLSEHNKNSQKFKLENENLINIIQNQQHKYIVQTELSQNKINEYYNYSFKKWEEFIKSIKTNHKTLNQKNKGLFGFNLRIPKEYFFADSTTYTKQWLEKSIDDKIDSIRRNLKKQIHEQIQEKIQKIQESDQIPKNEDYIVFSNISQIHYETYKSFNIITANESGKIMINNNKYDFQYIHDKKMESEITNYIVFIPKKNIAYNQYDDSEPTPCIKQESQNGLTIILKKYNEDELSNQLIFYSNIKVDLSINENVFKLKL